MGLTSEGIISDSKQKDAEEKEDGIHAPSNKEVPLFDMRLRKLEVPIFKGEDDGNPDGWLHRVERYLW